MNKKQASILVMIMLALLGCWQGYKHKETISRYLSGSNNTSALNTPDPATAELKSRLKLAEDKISDIERRQVSTETKIGVVEKQVEGLVTSLVSLGKRLTDSVSRTDYNEQEMVELGDWLNEVSNKITKFASFPDKAAKLETQMAQIIKTLAQEKEQSAQATKLIARLEKTLTDLQEKRKEAEQLAVKREQEARAEAQEATLQNEPQPLSNIPKVKIESTGLALHQNKEGEWLLNTLVSFSTWNATHKGLTMVAFIKLDPSESAPQHKLRESPVFSSEEGQMFSRDLFFSKEELPEKGKYWISFKFFQQNDKNLRNPIAITDWTEAPVFPTSTEPAPKQKNG